MKATIKMELLRANHIDSTGDTFTHECLEKAAADAKNLLIKKNFDRGADTVGVIDHLYMEGDSLIADCTIIDDGIVDLMQAIKDTAKPLELAAGGVVGKDDYESVPGGRIIRNLELTDTALTLTKVK